MMRSASTAAVLLSLCAPIAGAAVFTEDFNDGNAAARWSIVSQQEIGGSAGPDGSVDFAFDYSTLGIANPGGGGDTIGAFLQFNKTDQVGNEGESYSIFPTGQSFTGNYSLTLDMFVYNDGNGGSTEFGMAGVFLNNADPVSPYEFGTEGGPLAWTYSGDGAATRDLAGFAEGDASDTGYFSLGDYPDGPAIPGFDTDTGPASAANPRGSWVDVEIRVQGDTITWLLNGTVVDTYDNSAGFYTLGNILIGGADPFNSANAGNGVIVDNVAVTALDVMPSIPEPATAGLTLATLAGLALRRRNRSA